MAARSYIIPDLDDDEKHDELPNLFSKRIKTDDSSTINNTGPSESNSISETDVSSRF